jgi:hypothetical protein
MTMRFDNENEFLLERYKRRRSHTAQSPKVQRPLKMRKIPMVLSAFAQQVFASGVQVFTSE